MMHGSACWKISKKRGTKNKSYRDENPKMNACRYSECSRENERDVERRNNVVKIEEKWVEDIWGRSRTKNKWRKVTEKDMSVCGVNKKMFRDRGDEGKEDK